MKHVGTTQADGSGTGAAERDDVVEADVGGEGTGLESNVAGALSYLLGLVTGVIFFVVEPDDEFVRFHAAQSIATFGIVFVASIVLSVVGTMVSVAFLAGGGAGVFVGGILSLFLALVWLVFGLGALALWLFLMLRAYQGATPRVPVAAGIADRLV